MNKYLIIAFAFSLYTLSSSGSSTVTTVKLAQPAKGDFSRHSHGHRVLKLALDKTISTYGEYKIKYTEKMVRNRAIEELKKNRINAHIAPTRNEWENQTFPIYIPVSKGLLGYRLLLIKRDNIELLRAVKTKKDLMKLRAGLGRQWSTTKVLKKLKYNIVTGINYNGLFHMLNKGRFDYFIRGVNEVFGELNNIKDELNNIVLEQNLAVYIPMPIYIFVSPKEPQLAKRIEEGLEMAIKDGSFDKLFRSSHQKSIDKARLNDRKILLIGNPLLTPNKNTNKSKYWFKP